MQPEELPFTPEAVDELIDRQLGMESAATPAARLVRDLHTQYRNEAETAATLTGAWGRIQQRINTSAQLPHPITTHGATSVTDNREHTNRMLTAHAIATTAGRTEPQRRLWFGALVAILIVALGSVVFALRPHSTAHPASVVGIQATPTAVAHQQWTHDTPLDYQAPYVDTIPAIAPSNPDVVYEAYLMADGTTTAYRRTDDGGRTWHALTLPVPGTTDHTYFRSFVSPFDPKTVFMQIFEGNKDYCPLDVQQPNSESGKVDCNIQYLSTDAGAHWQYQHLPLKGTFNYDIENAQQDLRAQGQRLYMTLDCIDTSCPRIITSTDGGKTWSLVDAPIAAKGQVTCDFSVTPTGSTIVAFAAQDCNYSYQPHPLHLWQSDDAGATWRDAGTVPTPNLMGSALTGGSDSAHPLVYADLATTVASQPIYKGTLYTYSTAPSNIKVTADGGVTWQAAPVAGIPDGQGVAQLLTALPDGAILVEFAPLSNTTDSSGNPQGNTYYTWKQGDTSWHQFGDFVSSRVASYAITTSTDAGWNVWLTIVTFKNVLGKSTEVFMQVFKI